MEQRELPAPRQRLRAVVHGRVQGVNFRHHARQRALVLGLTGTVRNRSDETVEVVAEGDEHALRALLGWLQQGPSRAHVTRVEASWLASSDEFDSFEVLY